MGVYSFARGAGAARAVGATAAIAAAALLITGCASPAGGADPDSASAVQKESFPGAYAQTIEWGACDGDFALEESGAPLDDFECAMVEAPMDWNNPGNHETIELAVSRIAATGSGEPRGVLFTNPGGPGASGLDLNYGLASSPALGQVREEYDLIGMDPRGIGRSTPVECEDVSEIATIQLAACIEEFPIAHSMGTSQVARDMDLLRELLGDERMNYLGYSYGTLLGGTYSTLFPERVGRMILDSAIDPRSANLVGKFDQFVAIDSALDTLLADCGAGYAAESCPIGDTAALGERIGELTEQPLVASDGGAVGGNKILGYLISSLYGQKEARTDALTTVARALGGDAAAIDKIQTAMAGGGANVNEGGQIVSCHSFPREPDIAGFVEYVLEIGMPKIVGGPEVTDANLAQFVDLSCFALPEAGDDLIADVSGSPAATMLVIGITGDHATPFAGSEAVARELGNARLVTLEGRGHGASFSNRSSCVDAIATDYLLRGDVPEKGTVCTDD